MSTRAPFAGLAWTNLSFYEEVLRSRPYIELVCRFLVSLNGVNSVDSVPGSNFALEPYASGCVLLSTESAAVLAWLGYVPLAIWVSCDEPWRDVLAVPPPRFG